MDELMSAGDIGKPAIAMAKFDYDILAPQQPAIFSGVISQNGAKIAGIEAWAANDQVLEGMLFNALNEVRARRRGVILPK
jgi:hypothetical protein